MLPTAAWSVKHGSDTAPFAAAGVILLASTFLDPTTLPQFGVLAMVGLCLMALEARIPNGIIAAAPALTLLGYAFVHRYEHAHQLSQPKSKPDYGEVS